MLQTRLNAEVLRGIIEAIPTAWLKDDSLYPEPDLRRSAYLAYLLDRLAASHFFGC